jgi:hypothetical protein
MLGEGEMIPTKFSKTGQKLAHELIAETAREMAGAFYEIAASESDDFFKFYPEQKIFISREWGRFVEPARIQLSAMLGMTSMPEDQKEQIFNALIKHASLPGNIPKPVAAKMIAEGDVPTITPPILH